MAGPAWPGSEVRSAADRQRTAIRQAVALAAFTVAGSTWVAAAEADSVALLATALAGAALVVELTLALLARDRLRRGADDLILEGFRPHVRDDQVSAAVRNRTSQLRGPARRVVLAQVRFQAGLAGDSNAAFRAPVARYPVLLERIAAGLEDEGVDPRAVILLRRLICEPAPETIGQLRTGRSVEERLLEVLAILSGDL